MFMVKISRYIMLVILKTKNALLSTIIIIYIKVIYNLFFNTYTFIFIQVLNIF